MLLGIGFQLKMWRNKIFSKEVWGILTYVLKNLRIPWEERENFSNNVFAL